MSNITSINNEYVKKPIGVTEKEASVQQKPGKKEEKVQDVLDEKLKNSIKNENMIASDQDVTTAEEANLLLTDILKKLSNSPSAPAVHTQLDATRVNALVNS